MNHASQPNPAATSQVSAGQPTLEALRASEAMFRAIADSSPDVEAWFGLNGKLLWVNPTAEQITGYTPAEMIALPDFISGFVAEEDRPEFATRFQAALAGGQGEDFEFRYLHKQGLKRWLTAAWRPLFDRDGTMLGIRASGRDSTRRKQASEEVEQRLAVLTRPPIKLEDVEFESLFNLTDLQRIQDEFAAATGVASLITRPDGTPITQPSNFCRLCRDLIRGTEMGRHNCFHSDALIGRQHSEGPVVQPCLSGGLWDAGASITVGDRHVANWLIGQVRDETQSERKMRAYARSIGADEAEVVRAFHEVPAMSAARFQQIAKSLFTLANQLSTSAFQNIQQARFIAELKKAEAGLEQERNLLRTLIDHIPDAIFVRDTANRFLLANKKQAERLGIASPADLIGKTNADFFTAEQAAQFAAVDREVVAGRALINHEQNVILPGGIPSAVLLTKVPLKNPQGDVIAIVGIGRDITERKRVEEAHTQLATAVEQAAETIVITDTLGTILYVNPAFEKTSGYTRAEALGLNPSVLKSGKQDAGFYRQMWAVLMQGEVWSGHFINRRKDGTLFEEEATISPVRDAGGKVVNYVAVKRDVTHEMQLQAQLRQSQKMEAIGQLAGGVAHDFNNILSSMLMQTELVAMIESLPEEARDGLQQICADAHRAADLTRQLLLFSRRQVMQSRQLDLNDVVTHLAKMLQRIIGEDVQLHLHLHTSPLLVHADAGMLDQVLLNLAVNARDAMPEGGRVLVETSQVTIDEQVARLNPDASPGCYACLSVSDTGGGIPPEVLPRIFEPFFTTKEVGKGTGLGLATVFGIVKQHGGWIKVANQLGQGATFKVFLPASGIPSAAGIHAPATQPRGGKETILWAEDEVSVRQPTRRLLERYGYTVLEAANGAEALKLWQQHHASVALLLTDLVMPGGLSGRELARQLQAGRPQLKVIYTSGYSAEIAGREMQLRSGENFIQKPFTTNQLLNTIRQSLDH